MLYIKTSLISVIVCSFLLVSGALANNVVETNENVEQASSSSKAINPNKGGSGIELLGDLHCQRPALSGSHKTRWATVGKWYKRRIEISGWTTTKITCPPSQYVLIVKLDVNMTIVGRNKQVLLNIRKSRSGPIKSMSGYASKRYLKRTYNKAICGIAHHKVTAGGFIATKITKSGAASYCAPY